MTTIPERQLSTEILETAPDGLAVTDRTGRLLFANAAFRKLVGEARSRPGEPLQGIFPSDAPPLAHLAGDTAFACAFESAIENADGPPAPVFVTGDLAELAGETVAITWFRDLGELKVREAALVEAKSSAERAVQDLTITWFEDITARKATEAELRVAKEVSERTLRDLKEAQEHLVEAEKMASLGGLVAGVAHEINTPVGIALTAATHLQDRTVAVARLLADGGLKRSDLSGYLAVASETSDLLLSNLRRAVRLVESFKQVATDRSSEEVRTINLAQYIDEILVSLGPRIRQSGHSVQVTCPPELELKTYPGAFSQVLTNLVINSITHAFIEGQVGTMKLTVRPEPEGMLRINFHDDGRGIPLEHQERVFDPFFTTRRGSGGTGLGLHIVFQIVTQTLGGRIKLRSEPGATTFSIRIPENISI